MSFRSLPILSFALLAAVSTACRDDSGDGDDDGNNPDGGDGDGGGGEMTVQDVQNDATPVATAVTLKGVVVTAIDNYGGRKGNFYVAEPDGGEYSGVLVYGAPLDQVANLAVGDLVDISGAEKDEYSLADDDATVTELIAAAGGELTVTKTGTGTVPAPHVVDALAIGQMAKAAREAEYEKWEGVLIQVNNVSVIDGLRDIGSTDPDFQGFGITGLYEVDSSLAAIPQDPDHVARGDCLASVTGMGDYFYEYKVLPRATADIVAGGTGCPAEESACTDTTDNDANGYADCMDNACLGTEPTCTSETTVLAIQMNSVDGQGVSLNDVVVTGRDTFTSALQGIWVSDAPQAAPNTGIYVFTSTTTPDAAWTIGSLVDVMGTVDEYDNQITEITNPTITAAVGGGTAPIPLTNVTAATLSDLTAGEPYEGVLVRLASPMVTNNAVGNNRVQLTVGGSTIVVDDDAYMYNATDDFPMGMTLGCITGIMHWNSFEDQRTLVPRAPTDIVAPGGSCP